MDVRFVDDPYSAQLGQKQAVARKEIGHETTVGRDCGRAPVFRNQLWWLDAGWLGV